MKDIKFTGGTLTQQVVFRVDSINGSNLTVMETYGLNDRQPETINTELERDLIKSFPKIPSTIDALVEFAEDNGLDLVISDTNAENESQLAVSLVVDAPVDESTGTDTTPTFSGTGTPGADVAIDIQTDDVQLTTTVDVNGDWTVTSSVLAVGEKTATIVLTKGSVSKEVAISFEITL